MSRVPFVRGAVLALALTVVSTSAFAQAQPAAKPFEPTVGQQGKDVVWVPTPDALVNQMLDMARVTPQDYVIDLGSGDGRTVIAAAKRGARALGIEYNPDMVELSNRNLATAGVPAGRASFRQADLFATDFSQATVVTMFLLPTINMRLRPTILEMKPGTRIVSNTFTMEDWKPDQSVTLSEGCTTWCTAHLWIVPAKADGSWRLGDADLTLTQTFQMLTGTLRTGGSSVEITDGKMAGDQISFTAGGQKYTGRVNGNAMQGTMSGARAGNWSAARAGAAAAAR
jgi:hypothetical protein